MTDPQIKLVLQTAIKEYNYDIVIRTQCRKGNVSIDLYSTGSYYKDLALINANDMSVEACAAKLAYLIGNGYQGKDLKELYEKSLHGELTSMNEIKGRIVDYKHKYGDTYVNVTASTRGRSNTNSVNNNVPPFLKAYTVNHSNVNVNSVNKSINNK